MDKTLYRVTLTGELVSGFSRQAVVAALARLFEVSAAEIGRLIDNGECAIDGLLGARDAATLQQRLELLGARARVDRASVEFLDDEPGGGMLHLPRYQDPASAGLMHCPACGHEQLVASRCDECGIVFADYNRQRSGGARARAEETRPKPAARRSPHARASRDIHAAAHERWRNDWMDDDEAVPTEQYHLSLFMGSNSVHLSEVCEKLILGNRTRFKVGWAGGAVFSPFLWAMYRKMWAWGTVIFVFEILLPVVLITLGAQDGVSPKVSYLGLFLLLANRLFWPAILKSLYCRHARRTIMYLHRLSPTFASDIDIATRGGTSRTSAFVGMVLAIVVSLLAWSIVDTLHAKFMRSRPAFSLPAELTQPLGAGTPPPATTGSQDELLVNENKWVSTRNKLRLLGQRVNAWLVDGGRSADIAQVDIDTIAKALALGSQDTLDGWDRQIRFRAEGNGYRLISAGPDGQFGNTDDVEYRRIVER